MGLGIYTNRPCRNESARVLQHTAPSTAPRCTLHYCCCITRPLRDLNTVVSFFFLKQVSVALKPSIASMTAQGYGRGGGHTHLLLALVI